MASVSPQVRDDKLSEQMLVSVLCRPTILPHESYEHFQEKRQYPTGL